jgi:hypothetical protein
MKARHGDCPSTGFDFLAVLEYKKSLCSKKQFEKKSKNL